MTENISCNKLTDSNSTLKYERKTAKINVKSS